MIALLASAASVLTGPAGRWIGLGAAVAALALGGWLALHHAHEAGIAAQKVIEQQQEAEDAASRARVDRSVDALGDGGAAAELLRSYSR